MRKQKLELTWIGKETRPHLEPRILLEDPEKSYHAAHRVSEEDIFDNRLIFGDNLLALKALEQEFIGKIKCIYIDPPYNTGSAFTHYDDGVEHSLWLSLMRDRIEILRRLLTEDGTLWINLDDNEAHYCKVLTDEIFGRDNFVSTVVWERTTSTRNDAKYFSVDQDYIFVFAKDKLRLKLNGLPRTESSDRAYSNPDNDPRGEWREIDYKCAKTAEERPNLYYAIKHPVTGKDVWPRRTRVWAYGPETHEQHLKENLLWWGKTGNYTLPKLKRFRTDAPSTLVPRTLWFTADVDQTRTARKEIKDLFPDVPFDTPKPEKLIHRIVTLATNSGDIILDSFAGSGTTGAVAHKMGRKWIMVELGEHCHTHIIPRLKKVIDGEDPGGVTEACDWKGGGGFRYYKLAPSLLEQDEFGNWIINKKYNAAMLAEALCKLEGFTYAPSEASYWQHGHSTETDFIYVTTQTLSREQLQKLSDEVGSQRSLLICCAAFRVKKLDDFPNLTLKKIPLAVMSKCEWGKDDYSLEIKALPDAPEQQSAELVEITKDLPKTKRKARKAVAQQSMLFTSED
jgi:adenine-specific DNA-methyltransferase